MVSDKVPVDDDVPILIEVHAEGRLHKNLAIMFRSREQSKSALDSVPRDLPAHFISTLDEMKSELDARNIQFVLSTFIVKYRHGQERTTQIANANRSRRTTRTSPTACI